MMDGKDATNKLGGAVKLGQQHVQVDAVERHGLVDHLPAGRVEAADGIHLLLLPAQVGLGNQLEPHLMHLG